MSTSNDPKSKITGFAGKQFESTKIGDEVKASANRKENYKQVDISKKMSQYQKLTTQNKTEAENIEI